MESEQPHRSLDLAPQVPSDEWLLRLHFSPEHLSNGELIPTAISISDLKERGFSVDRESIVDPAVIEARAISQQQKVPEKRETPYLSRFECISIRRIKYGNGIAFDVFISPTDENPAHAHILSAQKKLGKAELRKLRDLLLQELQTPITLDQYITDRQQQFQIQDDSTTFQRSFWILRIAKRLFCKIFRGVNF
jgi:hypothetical protein